MIRDLKLALDFGLNSLKTQLDLRLYGKSGGDLIDINNTVLPCSTHMCFESLPAIWTLNTLLQSKRKVVAMILAFVSM